MKATHLLDTRPHKYEDTYPVQFKRVFVYVGNAIQTKPLFFGIGSMFKRSSIYHNATGLIKPFRYGDVFVRFINGEPAIVAKVKTHNQSKTRLIEVTEQELKAVEINITKLERELKWRRGSYCEDKRRVEFRNTRSSKGTNSPYLLTSNAEAIRRAKRKHKDTNNG